MIGPDNLPLGNSSVENQVYSVRFVTGPSSESIITSPLEPPAFDHPVVDMAVARSRAATSDAPAVRLPMYIYACVRVHMCVCGFTRVIVRQR